ncbi:MAG: 1-deoxy-D-xylulose-5-phosphate reductoisomerase [Thermanaeromonas sp.]|uniref:1-deoxy-D-xylulose-5-phosphate reductoisomerase n=1 Tax=Thermanaeromonas sp. TaxID=2003697 RepID=UPI00243C820A|nr:1-deoxy-D-xylulose-5-phosphate reductoisomerase [Thermanaeromonas sp.]MCG0277248.1 1-deoxy-D-xylulose-5-phosphate reductoisomerase [Thermanaeromonas sp.]
MGKGIAILGSTGCIGRQALQVIESLGERFQVLALAAGRNIDLLEEQVRRYHPRLAVVLDEDKARRLKERLSGLRVEVAAGEAGLIRAATFQGVDLVFAAMVGVKSLPAVLAAIQEGKNIALANKEILVAAGTLVMEEARKHGVHIIPVDSEHSAIFQCLGQGGKVKKITITASGGPFRELSREEMDKVTPEMALAHPNWRMGRRISIDSATLMNKGFEVIEARHLFDLDYEQIEVLVHPQSVIHGLVTYADGSTFAHLSYPDMRLPIQYAFTWPERLDNPAVPFLELATLGQLTFERPDGQRFPCLGMALEAGRQGGTLPAVLNAADEVAVELFLQGRIKFTAIPRLIEETLDRHEKVKDPTLEDIWEADAWARRQVWSLVEGKKG